MAARCRITARVGLTVRGGVIGSGCRGAVCARINTVAQGGAPFYIAQPLAQGRTPPGRSRPLQQQPSYGKVRKIERISAGPAHLDLIYLYLN